MIPDTPKAQHQRAPARESWRAATVHRDAINWRLHTTIVCDGFLASPPRFTAPRTRPPMGVIYFASPVTVLWSEWSPATTHGLATGANRSSWTRVQDRQPEQPKMGSFSNNCAQTAKLRAKIGSLGFPNEKAADLFTIWHRKCIFMLVYSELYFTGGESFCQIRFSLFTNA